MTANLGPCPLCGGERQPGITTFAVNLKFGVVVVREVPAFVCVQCGDAWIDNPVSAKLESIVAETRRKQTLVDVTQWQQVARSLSGRHAESACLHTLWRRVRAREVPCWYLRDEVTMVTLNRLPGAQEKMVHQFYSVGGDMKATRLVVPAGAPACSETRAGGLPAT